MLGHGIIDRFRATQLILWPPRDSTSAAFGGIHFVKKITKSPRRVDPDQYGQRPGAGPRGCVGSCLSFTCTATYDGH
jgi:hypothetical protein